MPQFVNTKIVLLAGKAGQRCNVPVAYLDCCNAAIIDRLRKGLCEYVRACVVCPSQGQGRGALYFLVKHMGTQTARTYIVRLTNAPSEATNWLYFAFYRDNLFSTLLGAITCLPVLHEVSLHEKTPLQCQTVLETFVHGSYRVVLSRRLFIFW